ncbi:MAG: GGDEF domain-containing protein [Clostridiales bacterium]|nr:GGDEF domain-containing protein [Clostridiales bacterium]
MRHKKIALFMNEITQFFQESFGKAISDHASSNDTDVIIYSSYGSYTCPYGRNLLSEMGKKNIIRLPDYSKFDAIIVLPNTFDIYGMDTEFFDILKKEAACPVICLQNVNPDFYSITIENKDTMYRMTRHFIDDHGFTDLRYMSGPFTSKDSPERLDGFKKAMEEAGLEIKENTVYEGNYWTNRGKKALDFFIGEDGKYPEAIICANDYMAISICEELAKRGLRVPEDVSVSGFDGIKEGEFNTPSLTTVTVSPENYADTAWNLIMDLWAGKDCSKIIKISDEINLRASCGCGKQSVSDQLSEYVKKTIHTDFLLREAGRITTDYQNRYDLDNSLSVANYYFKSLDCDTGYLCLCDLEDPSFASYEQNKIYTDEMVLVQKMDSSEPMHADISQERYNKEDILPDIILDTENAGTYIVFPLYYKNKEYGILVLKPEEGQWPNSLTSTYTNALSAAVENSYLQSTFSELAEIKKLSETDHLTGLYNRRGFENALARTLSSIPDDKIVSIVSIDMDDLKLINDKYGHSEGDYALITLANTLKSFTNEDEICARFGGDEFSAVLISEDKERSKEFVDSFLSELSNASLTSGKPYPIHASTGVCELMGGDTKQIIACMQTADQHMYMNKRSYKKAKAR